MVVVKASGCVRGNGCLIGLRYTHGCGGSGCSGWRDCCRCVELLVVATVVVVVVGVVVVTGCVGMPVVCE